MTEKWRAALGSVASPELIAIAVAVALLVTTALVVAVRRRRRRPSGHHGPGAAADESALGTAPAGLRQGLAKTRSGMLQRLLPLLGRRHLDPDTVEQLEAALLAADVGVKTTQRLIASLEHRRDQASSASAVLEEEVVAILEGARRTAISAGPDREPGMPFVVMVVGVNGVGKTTSIGKLAARYVREGKRTMVVAADTFRAAAIEQLAVWAERSGAEIVRQQQGGDPGAVAFDGMRAAVARKMDVVIVDTAGRLHTKSNLMDELRKVRRVVGREIPGAPHETWLVVDAVTGQNGFAQARAFREDIDISGIILTKLDGTARGGIVLAIAGELNLPIRFVGVGEGIDDLREFDPVEFAAALLAPPETSNLA